MGFFMSLRSIQDLGKIEKSYIYPTIFQEILDSIRIVGKTIEESQTRAAHLDAKDKTLKYNLDVKLTGFTEVFVF